LFTDPSSRQNLRQDLAREPVYKIIACDSSSKPAFITAE